MLHKGVQHLLPTIYDGRIGQATGQLEGKEIDQNKIGGLTFNMLESHDLAFDRNAYLRQRDEDAMTVSSANALGGIKSEAGHDYFDQRRAEYLKNGAPGAPGGRNSPYGSGRDSPFGTPPMHTPEGDLPYELSRMPTHNGSTQSPYGSTEQLIQYPPSYTSPQHQQQQRGRGHAPQMSGGSQVSLDQYYGQQQPAYNYPPQGSYGPPPHVIHAQAPMPPPGASFGMPARGTPSPPRTRPASPGAARAYSPQQSSRLSGDWTQAPPAGAGGARVVHGRVEDEFEHLRR